MRGACVVCLLLAVAAGRAAVVFEESFEADDALTGWRQETTFTATTAALAAPGLLSARGLEVRKLDTCGFWRMYRSVELTGGHHYRLTLDLRAVDSGPYAGYFLMVTPLAGAKPKMPNLFFAFDDGISPDNAFGDAYKTPRTLGEWKTTEHLFRLDDEITGAVLSLVVRDGRQVVQFDNLRLEDCGVSPVARRPLRAFARRIDWPYAELDLDLLIPGFTYEVRAAWRQPTEADGLTPLSPGAKLSDQVAPPDSRGMGISAAFTDFRGQTSARQELPEVSRAGQELVYLLTVPRTAVATHLDLHNDDLVRFNHNQIQAQARRFTDVSVQLHSRGEIVVDNAWWQYLYRGRPESLKPRRVIDLSGFDLAVLAEHQRRRQPVDALVKEVNGGLCLEIGGRPRPPMFARTTQIAMELDLYSELARNGLDLVTVHCPYGGVANHGWWSAEGQYDFRDLDANVYRVLATNPDAYLILDLYACYPPGWWGEAHPEELATDQHGNVVWCHHEGLYQRRYGPLATLREQRLASDAGDGFQASRGAKYSGFYLPSPASTVAREAVNGFLTALRRYVAEQPYGVAVVGYSLMWGFDGQWHFIEDAGGSDPHYTDFSAPMLRRYRHWLKDKYGTDEALRKAWGNPQASLAGAPLPGVERRDVDQTKSDGYLLDPATDQPLIDYRECENRTIGETLVAHAQAVKAAGERQVLVTAYYPDISSNATGGAGRQGGHDYALAQPGLDLSGTPVYHARSIGLSGVDGMMLDSFKLHRTIPMKEIDHRVFPVVNRSYSNNEIFETPRKSIAVLRREYTKAICRGGGAWTFDMGYGWFADPLIAGTVGQAYKLFQSVLERDRSSVAKMAMFVGETGKNVQGDARRGGIPLTLVTKTKAVLAHVGVPVDEYQLVDLPAVASRYQVFWFPFCYALTEPERAAIEALKRDGNVLVFGYGAGYAGRALSGDQVSSLIGMTIGRDDRLGLTVRITNREHPLTRDTDGWFGAAGANLMEAGLPRIYVDDPAAVTLGELAGDGHRAGLAVKDCGAWKSIYIGAIGLMPPELLRGVARYAGLHVYNDSGDVLFVCHDLVGLHASSDGEKVIALPEEATVTSLWDQKPLGRATRIVRPMKTGDTALYLIERERK